MIVDYALSTSVFLPALGAFNSPVPGVGTFTVRYNSATGPGASATTGTVFHGGARVLGGTNMVPVSFTIFGGTTVTGFSTSAFGVGAPGTLSSGGNLVLGFQGTNMGVVHCTGALCSGLVGIPPSLTITLGGNPLSVVGVPLPLPLTFAISATGLGAVGVPSTITFAPLVGTAGGQASTTFYTATEISRHYVPEPSTLPLLGMGLAFVGVAGRRFGMLKRR